MALRPWPPDWGSGPSGPDTDTAGPKKKNSGEPGRGLCFVLHRVAGLVVAILAQVSHQSLRCDSTNFRQEVVKALSLFPREACGGTSR
jgi:hypothetical protein